MLKFLNHEQLSHTLIEFATAFASKLTASSGLYVAGLNFTALKTASGVCPNARLKRAPNPNNGYS